jgi:arabinofuranan 3-O-arabinosyltransferase
VRLVAACVLLFGIAFVQEPGFLVSDTKFDLAIAPAEFLGRALHLWDGQGEFGQLQNQAYGYLWPMGSFFLVGWLAAIPGWVVQRLWLGLVMSVAFVGTARVARALGVRSDLACILAGVAFALSPRMLTTLGPISIEAWPSALAPWVLLPLIRGAQSGSPRRAAALSAVAVAMVGGVNAAATAAVLPLGAVYLLTRTPGPRRRALMTWWPLFTALGTLWWLVPLFVMGAYSPPFLDFIETTSVTTFPTTLFDALRGTSNWVPYVDSGSRAGNDLLRTPYLMLNSGVVLLLGFAGLIDRRNPHRRFLGLALLLGVVMVTAGHQGSVEGWFAGGVRGLLDGALAPLRNVHKFDPVIRLPLVLGLAHVLDRALARGDGRAEAGNTHPGVQRLHRLHRVAFVGMAVVAVVGAALPAATGRIPPSGATLGVPGYWKQAAAWLGEESDDGTALLVPGAPFGAYIWGRPQDEPMQSLAQTRWAVRNVIPLTPPGNIRMLDAIEARFAQGAGSAGLTATLRRGGVEFLVVRNDLARGSDVPDPVLVHQAIAQSPGLDRVAAFGPDLGGGGHLNGDDGRVLVNGGWQSSYPAVEIFTVRGQVAGAVSSDAAPVVVGGPEDLPDLLDLGVLGEGPSVLASDTSTAGADGERPPSVVLTDGLRARERFFPRIHDGASAAITPGDVRRSGNPSRDYLVGDSDRWSTTVRLTGVASISASSSMSDADALGGVRRGELPYAALDGSPDTQWVSGAGREGQAWWRVDLEEPRLLTSITLTGGADAQENQLVRVRSAGGVTQPVDLGPGETRVVELPPEAGRETSFLRVEDASGSGRSLALAGVDIAGVEARRDLVLPSLPEAWGNPDAVVLRADRDARTGCVEVRGDVRCVQGRDVASEEGDGMGRVVRLAEPGDWTTALTVRPLAGEALDQLVLQDQPVNITASSVGVPDPRASPLAAIDGDPGTTWTADLDDLRPALDVRWLGREAVTGLRFAVADNAAARRPSEVTLSWPGGRREVELDRKGRATFPRIRTDQLRIQITDGEPVSSLGFDAQKSDVAYGVGELRLTGVPYLPVGLSLDPVAYPCGSGPEVDVNGRSYRSALRGAPADLAAGRPADARLCRESPRPAGDRGQRLELREGENRIEVRDAAAFAIEAMVLRNPSSTAVATAAHPAPETSGAATRTIVPDPGAVVVALRENANRGWRATQDGQELAPVVLDGWQQGWVLRDSTSPVQATFAPDRPYRWGLVAGGLCLVGLVVLTFLTRGRWAGPVPAPVGTRRLSREVLVACAVVGSGLVAGWVGVAIAVVVVAADPGLRRLSPDALPWVLSLPCLIAAAAYAVTPWGSSSGWAGNESWPAYLMLVPLVGLLASEAWEAPRRLSRLSLRAGRSTRR